MDLPPLTDDDVLTFGVHEGKKLKDVPADYLDYIQDLSWVRQSQPRLLAYIQKNAKLIEEEMRKAGKL